MFLNDPFTGEPSIPFTLYAMECEGDLDTETGKRNRIIKNLRQRAQWSPIDETDVVSEAAAAGLPIPTDQEVEEIIKEVNCY